VPEPDWAGQLESVTFETPGSDAPPRLLAQLDGQLPLRLRHLAPQLLQVGLNTRVVGLFPQCPREPSIRRRKIVWRA
jgi:hypothetical protein